MHTHWDDTPYDEGHSHLGLDQSAGDPATTAAPAPPPDLTKDAKIPFMKLQGRWLCQMGFNVGSRLKIDAAEGVITISLIGSPVMPQNGVPRTLERKIQYAEVEADKRQPILSGDPR